MFCTLFEYTGYVCAGADMHAHVIVYVTACADGYVDADMCVYVNVYMRVYVW